MQYLNSFFPENDILTNFKNFYEDKSSMIKQEKKEFKERIPVSSLSLIDKSCQPMFEDEDIITEPEMAPPKPKEFVTFFINGSLFKILEDNLIPKINIQKEKVCSIFGSGKASFSAKSESCYIVT